MMKSSSRLVLFSYTTLKLFMQVTCVLFLPIHTLVFSETTVAVASTSRLAYRQSSSGNLSVCLSKPLTCSLQPESGNSLAATKWRQPQKVPLQV